MATIRNLLLEALGVGGSVGICPEAAPDCADQNPNSTQCHIQDTGPNIALNGWYRHDADNGGSFSTAPWEYRVGNNAEITREFAEPPPHMEPITYLWATLEVKVPHNLFLWPDRNFGGSHFFKFWNVCGQASPRNIASEEYEIHTPWGSPDKSGFRIKVRQFNQGATDPVLVYEREWFLYDSDIDPDPRA